MRRKRPQAAYAATVIAMLATGLLVAAVLLAQRTAAGNGLTSGTFVVSEATGGQITAVDPLTGDVAPFSNNAISQSAGGEEVLDFPFGMDFAGNGDLLVADRDAFGDDGGLIRVDRDTGAQTTVSSNAVSMAAGGDAVFNNAAAIVRTGRRTAYATNFGSEPNLAKVNLKTGKATIVSDEGKLVAPWGLLARGGDLIVVDSEAFGGEGGLIRVDPDSGTQRTISKAGKFREPYDVLAAPNGWLYASDAEAFGGNGGVLRVNPVTGEQRKLADDGEFLDPGGMAEESKNKLVLVDFGIGGVIRLNTKTLNQGVVSDSVDDTPLDVLAVP